MMKDAQRTGVYGASGTGKSHYVKQLIRPERRLVVFDVLDEYRDLRRVDLNGVLAAASASYRDFRVRYCPPVGAEGDALSRLCDVLKVIQEPYKQEQSGAPELTLVVEELNVAFPVHGGEARARGFAEICSRGRHWGVNVLGVSQRIAEVSPRFRGNMSEVVIFMQLEPIDITRAKAALGRSVPVEEIEELQPREYIRRTGFSIDRKKNAEA